MGTANMEKDTVAVADIGASSTEADTWDNCRALEALVGQEEADSSHHCKADNMADSNLVEVAGIRTST